MAWHDPACSQLAWICKQQNVLCFFGHYHLLLERVSLKRAERKEMKKPYNFHHPSHRPLRNGHKNAAHGKLAQGPCKESEMECLRCCPTPFLLSVEKELSILHPTPKLGHKIHSMLDPQQATLNPGALVDRSLKSPDQTTKTHYPNKPLGSFSSLNFSNGFFFLADNKVHSLYN